MEQYAKISGEGERHECIVVVEVGTEMLKVFTYGFALGEPASLRKRQKYEMKVADFVGKIPEMERELGVGYSDWKFRPTRGALGSCGDHLKL